MNGDPALRGERPWVRILVSAVVCLILVVASGVAISIINATEPTAKQVAAKRKSAALVETITVERGAYSPRIVVLGAVEPAQDLTLSPRVSGQVVELSPKFAPGGSVRKGDLLLRIDPADFKLARSESKGQVQQAEASLEIEHGRQSLARKELALLEGTIEEANRALVLREPQIKSIEAQLSAAKAGVKKAKLELKRTTIRAPFDAHVLSRSFTVGSQVAPGDNLARLVGIEEYWIMASVPVRSLRWIQFPDSDGQGSSVTLRNPDTWPPGAERQGRVARMIGALEDQSRLARVLITVADPLARETDGPPLILGALLETDIEGRRIENVVRLSRDYVRRRDTVWVMKESKLEIRNAKIVFRDADYAYIQDGLESGEQVVTTTLATVANGVPLRKANSATAPSEDSGGRAD